MEHHRQDRGWMHLHLNFVDGAIAGEGVDYVGPWSIAGEYDQETGSCRWVKSYLGRHQVIYEGRLGADGIRGTWTIEPFLNSNFHIWPEWMSELQEKYMKENPPIDGREPGIRGDLEW